MIDLDTQLRRYGGYLDELSPADDDIADVRINASVGAGPGRHRGRWLAAAAAAVAIAVGAGVVVVAGHDSSHKVTTVGGRGAQTPAPSESPTTVPPPSSTPGASTPATTPTPTRPLAEEHPSFAEQVARLKTWYRNWPAEAPGGRPLLAAEYVFCDYRHAPAPLGGNRVQGMFASYFPLDQPLTDNRLVDGCLTEPDRFANGDPSSPPRETPAGQLPAHQLCSTDQRGPVYSGDTTAVAPVVKPVVVLGTGDCASAGYQPFADAILTELNTRRRVEIEMRAVPRDCPTEQEATAWVQQVAAAQLGPGWTVGGLVTAPRTPNGCFRPFSIDWDQKQAYLGQFDAVAK